MDTIDTIDFDRVNWTLFREQKLWLMLQNNEHANGIINMMDSIQDAAFATGRFTEDEIYGEFEEVD